MEEKPETFCSEQGGMVPILSSQPSLVFENNENTCFIEGNGELPRITYKYKTDTSVALEGKSYTVEELLHLSNDEFESVYEAYERYIGKMTDIASSNKFGVIVIPAINSLTSTMERVVLERKIDAIKRNFESELEAIKACNSSE